MMARFGEMLVFLCVLGKIAALGDETIPNVVLFGDGDFEVASEDQTRDRLVLQATKDQKPITIGIEDRKCQCSGTSCKCCAEVRILVSKLTVCAGFTFNPNAKTLEFTVTVDGQVVFKKTISVNVPVKFCHDFLVFGRNAQVCLSLSDISFQKGHTGACMYIEISYEVVHWKQKLGCIYKAVQPISNTKLKAISFFKK